MNPFASLFRSRKFLLAVGALIITWLSTYTTIPENLVLAIDGVIAAVIAGIAYEDAAQKSK